MNKSLMILFAVACVAVLVGQLEAAPQHKPAQKGNTNAITWHINVTEDSDFVEDSLNSIKLLPIFPFD